MLPRVKSAITVPSATAGSDEACSSKVRISRSRSKKNAYSTRWPAATVRGHEEINSNAPGARGFHFGSASNDSRATWRREWSNDINSSAAISSGKMYDGSRSAPHNRKGLLGKQRVCWRHRKRTGAENDLFTSFTLNRDSENSKYLPYDEVVYPKLFNRPHEVQIPRAAPKNAPLGQRREGGERAVGTGWTPVEGGGGFLPSAAAAELDNMWVVGFVENARRYQKDLLLKELRDFVRLPGSTVLPGSHAALATISQMEVSTSFKSSSTGRSSGKVRNRDDGGDEGRAPSPSGGARSARGEVGDAENDDQSSGGRTSALTPWERLKLCELERRLSQASLGVRDEDVRRHAGLAAYGAANRKLRKILRGARPPAIGPEVKSKSLEAIFQRNREELEAAIRVQRLYKHYYRRKRFDALIRQLKGIVRVQAFARGMIARQFVAEWYSRRSSMVLAWQTIIRRMLSNIHLRRRLEIEGHAASTIQAAARGCSAREKTKKRKASLAVLRIQCFWRGCVDRARVDRVWLGFQATRIQGLARMLVAKRVVERKRRIFNAAARLIQRCFRGTMAREVMKRTIWERGVARRVDFLRVLAAEEEWERENIEMTQRRSRRMRLEERLGDALSAETAAHAVVLELENNEKELRTQRQMLSPRALQQGWKEELDNNIGQHREWIMNRKLEAVFDATLPARQLEEEVGRRDDLLKQRYRQAARLARWREVEIRGIFDRETRRRFDDQHIQHLRKVADEKRKWAVKHVTLSGKPDKLKARRRIRPWEAVQDPAERVLKQVFTGGNVDLFAYDRTPEEAAKAARAAAVTRGTPPTLTNKGTKARHLGRGGKEGARGGGSGDGDDYVNVLRRGELPQIMAQLQLQSHINQVAQLDKIMRPAEVIVQRIELDALNSESEVQTADATNEAVSTTMSAKSPTPTVPRDVSPPPWCPPPLPPPEQEHGSDLMDGQEKFARRGKEDLSRQSVGEKGREKGEEKDGYGAALLSAWSRPAAAGFSNRYGVAASTPLGRPPPIGTGGTLVPLEWGEEERVRARQRQRRLHMLVQRDELPIELTAEGHEHSRSAGQGGGAQSRSRVPWHLLDELDAEKSRLSLGKMWR